MPIPLIRLVIYAHDVLLLKNFYQQHFDLPIIEEIAGEWVVFQAGKMELALHLVGQQYRNKERSAKTTHSDQGTKFVFAIDSGLSTHREKLLACGVKVSNLKRYDGFPYEMYDGRDPEGHIFQVMQFDSGHSDHHNR